MTPAESHKPLRRGAVCLVGEISCCLWVSWRRGKPGAPRVTGLVCLVAAGEDCIRIQEGTFAWSQESAPCLHRYRWFPW